MTNRKLLVLGIGLLVLGGCASTKVTEQTPMVQASIGRPNRIWVYDFVGASGDVPEDSSIKSYLSSWTTPQTSDQTDEGRQFGRLIAQSLVTDIEAMGLPAILAGSGASPQVGDGVIRGYLVSVEEGSAAKRFVIGFGAGTSEMDAVVEGYIMTPQGLQRLGSGTLSSSGSKTPGLIVPAAVTIGTGSPIGLIVMGGLKVYGEASGRSALEGRAKAIADAIADELKLRFQDRGWIASSP